MLRFSRAAGQLGPIVLADRARDARQWDVAVQHYRTALTRNPRNPPIWVQYGHVLKEAGRHAAAEAAYRRAIAGDPAAADPYLHLGHVLRLQGRTEEAKAAYLRACMIDPSVQEAAGELAALGGSVEDLPQLLRTIAPPVATSRTNGLAAGARRKRRKESVITRADRARDLGQWEIAARLYRRALDRNAGNPPIWLQYGHALKETGQLREAELAYRQATAHAPNLTDAHLELGRVLRLRGETEAAEQAFLQAFALDPLLPHAVSELTDLGWAEAKLAELRGFAGPSGPTSPPAAASEKINRPIVGLHAAAVLRRPHCQFRVLYVSSEPADRSHQYRIDNYIDALSRNDIDANWIAEDQCDHNIGRLHSVSLVVFWRVAPRPPVRRFIDAAERLRVPVVYDIDDYVFEPRIATEKYIDGLRFLPASELDAYCLRFSAYRAMLLSCQFATFPTQFLVDRGNELGRRSFLLPNGLDRDYANAEPIQRPRPADRVVIGYTPGTQTHQKDMRVAARAIARVLAENRDVIFRIVGYFEIDEIEDWRAVRQQIEHDPTIGRDHVRVKTAEFDVNIAPLELDNPFTEAKSELKYFEPASLGVPTVASATAVFRDAIRHGETGFVARSEGDWYTALTGLVRDRSLRERVAAAARTHARRAYGPETLGLVAQRAYAEMIRSYRTGIEHHHGDVRIGPHDVLDRACKGLNR